MRRIAGWGAWACAAAAGLAFAAGTDAIAPFSRAVAGTTLPEGWREQPLPGARPAEVALVRDEGATVLRVRSENAAGGAAHALRVPGDSGLRWRWKVDRVVEGADMATRRGDDYAARVYVFFDVPAEELPLLERAKIRLARLLHGAELPTAALCYVWDNRHSPGTGAWNAYTDRVRMIVVESGPANAGRWMEQRRDLAADFRAAFGAGRPGAVPAITGIAAGNDTDQTGASATAWFGDFVLEPRR